MLRLAVQDLDCGFYLRKIKTSGWDPYFLPAMADLCGNDYRDLKNRQF